MANTYYSLIEKDYDSEMSNAWKSVEGAPEFNTPSEAAEWLKSQGIAYVDDYRAVMSWAESGRPGAVERISA